MTQTRKMSAVETAASTAIGFGVALATQRVVFPLFVWMFLFRTIWRLLVSSQPSRWCALVVRRFLMLGVGTEAQLVGVHPDLVRVIRGPH